MVTWASLKSIALLLGPLVLPKAIAYYQSVKNRPPSQIKALQQKTSYALAVLCVSAFVALLTTLPPLSPENIFHVTHSRLHTSGGVLLARLLAVRALTPADQRLREIFDAGGLESRLLYARYGPDVLVESPLSTAGDLDGARDCLIYALPSILAPHLLHFMALGVATSGFLSGREGARWRIIAILAGLVLASVELYVVSTYDDTNNQRSVRVNDIDFLHWKLQVYRGVAIAATDAALALAIWLQATGRAFLSPTPASERIRDHANRLDAVLVKARGVGIIRNGSVRDASMRRTVDDYWVKESEVMKDVMEQPEVLEAQRSALRRMDAAGTAREADLFLDYILDMPPVPATL